jgi:Protein of unknown function (DUF2795)
MSTTIDTADTDDPAVLIRRALELGPLRSPPPPAPCPPLAAAGVGAGLNAAQVAGLLSGISYPARRWEILAWAQHNGASPMMAQALGDIPEDEYPGPHQIAEALHTAAEATGCCRHRRHPRHCPRHHSHQRCQPARSAS